MYCFFASNAFFSSFTHSDFFGKLIFLALFALSILTWSLFFYKWKQLREAQKRSYSFRSQLFPLGNRPLHLEVPSEERRGFNPFLSIYSTMRHCAIEILNKNRTASQNAEAILSASDVDLVEDRLEVVLSQESRALDKNLFWLATSVSLAPFLGLLGTVWGILVTFSELNSGASRASNELMLGGLSMALATTVVGLLIAIPALLAYNYLRDRTGEFSIETRDFAQDMIGAIELHYRKVDIS